MNFTKTLTLAATLIATFGLTACDKSEPVAQTKKVETTITALQCVGNHTTVFMDGNNVRDDGNGDYSILDLSVTASAGDTSVKLADQRNQVTVDFAAADRYDSVSEDKNGKEVTVNGWRANITTSGGQELIQFLWLPKTLNANENVDFTRTTVIYKDGKEMRFTINGTCQVK